MTEKTGPRYTLDDLLELMARLRDPEGGCAWDLKQNWQSIVPYTIEETFEVAEAITIGETSAIREELGDLLLQIVFYCQFAREENRFQFADVVQVLVEKLLRRHPHVFPDGTLQSRVIPGMTAEAVVSQWDNIKAEEKAGQQKPAGVLGGIPAGLPALQQAMQLQQKAGKVGFDWNDVQQVMRKLQEEVGEFAAELESGDRDAMEEEFGDMMFVMVNIARHVKIDPEMALRRTNQKFRQRFGYIERQLAAVGRSPAESTLQEMDALWDEAKGVKCEG